MTKSTVRHASTALVLALSAYALPTIALSDVEGVLQEAKDRTERFRDGAAERLEDERLGSPELDDTEDRMPSGDRPLPEVAVPEFEVDAASQAPVDEFLRDIEAGDLRLPDPRELTDGGVQLIAFVSFSMPDESLKNLIQEVNRAGGTVLMQGMHKDSYQETAQKAQELVGLSTDVHFNIDPRLFTALNIERVPTFALVKEPESLLASSCSDQGAGVCAAPDEDFPAVIVSGDVSLDYALQTIERRADSAAWSDVASNYRATLESD